MPPRYQPKAYALDPFRFGRTGCLWAVPVGGTEAQLAASVIHHAHSIRWTALIGYNVRAFCQQHEITYDRFRDVLRGDALMRDEDRALAIKTLGTDAIPEVAEIADYLRDATEDTGLTLKARRGRRSFNRELGVFEFERARSAEKHPSVAPDTRVQPLSMPITNQGAGPHENPEQVELLRSAAVRLYFDHAVPKPQRVNVEIWRRGVGTCSHATVDGHFGGGGIRLTAILRPEDELFTLAGLLVVDVAERDVRDRPTRVWALRALPEWVGYPPYEHADWEYATSPARIDYDPEPTATWEEPNITDAALAWGHDCGAPRRIMG